MASAQVPNFNWAKSCGGQSNDEAYSVTHDASGNVYVTGYFADTVDFDPGPGSYTLAAVGGDDVYILKLNASGNFVWAKSLGASGDEIGNNIKVDGNGNVYVTGYFENTVDFDPGVPVNNLASNGFIDIYILKLDGSGNFIWARQIGGVDYDSGLSLGIDNNANVVVGGSFQNAVDFDPGAGTFSLTAVGMSDAFLLKLDGSGNFVWAKQFGGTDNEVIWSVDLDVSGNCYSTGNFEGIADFDPGAGTLNLTSNGGRDVFVVKVDVSGNMVWAKSFGDANDDYGQGIAIDAFGAVNISGEFSSTVDFDPNITTFTLTSFGGSDIFISQLSSAGNFVWVGQLGGVGNDAGIGIDTDGNGSVYATGSFQGVGDFDPGSGTYSLTSNGARDIFAAMLNTNGNFGWAIQLGGTGSDEGSGISVDGNGNIYTAGYYRNTVDFDHSAGTFSLGSVGSSDVFIHKMNQIATSINENSSISSFIAYPNPTTDHLIITSQNSETFSFLNSLGQTLEEFTLIGSKKINISAYPKGIYFLMANHSGTAIKVLIE